MRQPTYLSHTALKLFEKNKEEYYLRYMAEPKPPRDPQTNYMAIGSAFDAYVKDALTSALFGGPSNFDALFTSSVEPQNRDWARVHGRYVFNQYVASLAYYDLLMELRKADRVFFDTRITVSVNGVPINGALDLAWTIESKKYILDWKVRGYCSRHAQSPTPGYVMVRDGCPPYSRSHGKRHSKCNITESFGILCNGHTIEKHSQLYADQLSGYSFALQVHPAEPVLVAIDELVCKPNDSEFPKIRVAQHRSMLPTNYRLQVAERYKLAWEEITTGLFDEETRRQLDGVASCQISDGKEDAFTTLTKGKTW